MAHAAKPRRVSQPAIESRKGHNNVRNRRREASAPLRKKLKDCERTLERLRAEIEKLDADLAQPDLYTRDPTKAASLAKARTDSVHAFARSESDWLDLSEELESLEVRETAAD